MKKLIFLFTMVLAVSMAMAQTNNTSEVTQSGVKQTATVDQQGMGDNTSYVIQANASNIATVSQINPIFDGSIDEDDNLSTVLQTGTKNKATVTQTHNRGYKDYPASGGLLEAVIEQSGNNNEAEQIQGPHNQMGESLASTLQSGNGNYALQHQLKYKNNAYIVQSGDRNIAMQAQDTELPEDGSANFASINQSGNNNDARQEQQGWSNGAIAEQLGSGNTSLQHQENNSWKSNASVLQVGNNNDAFQTSVGNLNDALIEQHSSGNTAKQYQTSGNVRPDGYGYDYPALNDARVYQLGGNSNEAIQTQENMEGNVSNFALIWQNGRNNFATQTQFEGFNTSTISQVGNGNIANVMQNQVLVP